MAYDRGFEDDVQLSNQELLKTGEFSDFRIISSEGFEFRVHRSILIPHSSFFRKIFSHDFSEKATGEVKLEEDTTTTFMLLYWMYTGDFAYHHIQEIILKSVAPQLSVEDLCVTGVAKLKLFMAADKYMIPRLARDLKPDLLSHVRNKPHRLSDQLAMLRYAYESPIPTQLRVALLYRAHDEVVRLSSDAEQPLKDLMLELPQMGVDMLCLFQVSRIKFACKECDTERASIDGCDCALQGLCSHDCGMMPLANARCSTCYNAGAILVANTQKIWLEDRWVTSDELNKVLSARR